MTGRKGFPFITQFKIGERFTGWSIVRESNGNLGSVAQGVSAAGEDLPIDVVFANEVREDIKFCGLKTGNHLLRIRKRTSSVITSVHNVNCCCVAEFFHYRKMLWISDEPNLLFGRGEIEPVGGITIPSSVQPGSTGEIEGDVVR